MSFAIFLKLIAIFSVVALGWIAGRARWLGNGDTARVLANAAFFLFIPALLFRTTARIDFSTMPWDTLAAFFAPVLVFALIVYSLMHRWSSAAGPASPGVRALAATFGNTVQLGIPLIVTLYGDSGLSVQLAIISLHALTLLTLITALVELDLARANARDRGGRHSLAETLLTTVRNTVIHPVVLPVLAGLAVNVSGFALPALVDQTLLLLTLAVVPVCLVVIGLSLEHYGMKGSLSGALWLSFAKLVVLPALVFVVGHWIAGLHGIPLAVIVICAALPVGSNALLFAQRYTTLQIETTAAIVLSTFGFVFTVPLWLLLLQQSG
jgi:malonate transporter